MSEFIGKSKIIYIWLFLVVSVWCSKSYGQTGLTSGQVDEIKANINEIVRNYYSNLNSIAAFASKNSNEASLFVNSTLQFFNSNDVEVFNDLIDGGSEYMEISQYLHTIITTFSKHPGNIEINGDVEISEVYWSKTDEHYVVKATIISQVQGDNTKGDYISNNNMLVVYFKIATQHNTYGQPSIYWIMHESKSSNKGLISIDIVDSEQVFVNTGEKIKLEKQLQESKAATDSLSDEIDQIRKEYQEKFNEIEQRERRIQRLEKEIESKNKLANDQLQSISRKENEIERQKKKLEKQEDEIAQKNAQLKQFENKLERTEKSIGDEKKNLYNYRRVLSLGIGMNQNAGTFNNICNANFNDFTVFNPQLRGMVGYRFDFRESKLNAKINRGHILAGFITYSFNKPQTITYTLQDQDLPIADDRQEPVYNRTLEIEAGLVLHEFLRLSGGIGGINGYKYNVATAAFHIPITRFGYIELGSSFLFSRDFKQPQMHPYASVSFEFNDNRAKSTAKKSSRSKLVTEWTTGISYDFISGYDDSEFMNYINFKNQVYFGYEIGDTTFLGFWGNAGNFNREFIKQLMNLYPEDYANETSYTNYNPYFHVDFGVYLKEIYRISYGYGYLYPGIQPPMPIHCLTVGANFPLYKDLVRMHIDLSDKLLNNDFQKHMFSVSMGMVLRFNWVKF